MDNKSLFLCGPNPLAPPPTAMHVNPSPHISIIVAHDHNYNN